MILKKISHNIFEICLDLKESIFNWIEGYGFVPISYYSDPKKEIANKTLSVLRSYRQLIIKGKNMSIPTWVVNEAQVNDFSEAQLNQIWLEYLNKMILAFDLVLMGDYQTELRLRLKKGLCYLQRIIRIYGINSKSLHPFLMHEQITQSPCNYENL
ncbi:hypothetical protein [Acinetobacter guillouiae]|uniref:hypothetical protein n=1 Tax=Acinetobacter guillouiae TaxID=106649 RepID=UPI0033426446